MQPLNQGQDEHSETSTAIAKRCKNSPFSVLRRFVSVMVCEFTVSATYYAAVWKTPFLSIQPTKGTGNGPEPRSSQQRSYLRRTVTSTK